MLMRVSHDFDWFFATRIRIRFIDTDPGGQNDPDPTGSGSTSMQDLYAGAAAPREPRPLRAPVHDGLQPTGRLLLFLFTNLLQVV